MWRVDFKFEQLRIIISPSGNLYGSENVLFDYLKHSKLKFKFIFVPQSSLFKEKLDQNDFKTKGFNNLKLLYFRVLLKLFTSKIKSVYCNEAGHIRYIYHLARLFPKVIFVVHVRILEDTLRIKHSLRNLKFVTISKTIQSGIQIASYDVYDGYHFSFLKNWHSLPSGKLVVGIVGRVTLSKGIGLFTREFFQICGANLEFHFYGDIDSSSLKLLENMQLLRDQKNVIFKGFVTEKTKIYTSVDLLLHVNENEPLGRIFFESLDFGIPFIGINKGGIGEIAERVSYPYVFEKNELAQVLSDLVAYKWTFNSQILEQSRKKSLEVFSIVKYSTQIDKILV